MSPFVLHIILIVGLLASALSVIYGLILLISGWLHKSKRVLHLIGGSVALSGGIIGLYVVRKELDILYG